MNSEAYGKRFEDQNQIMEPNRDRTETEEVALNGLYDLECDAREFIQSLPEGIDPRSKAMALTKLDEMVMWLKRGIDA